MPAHCRAQARQCACTAICQHVVGGQRQRRLDCYWIQKRRTQTFLLHSCAERKRLLVLGKYRLPSKADLALDQRPQLGGSSLHYCSALRHLCHRVGIAWEALFVVLVTREGTLEQRKCSWYRHECYLMPVATTTSCRMTTVT